ERRARISLEPDVGTEGDLREIFFRAYSHRSYRIGNATEVILTPRYGATERHAGAELIATTDRDALSICVVGLQSSFSRDQRRRVVLIGQTAVVSRGIQIGYANVP